MQEVVTADGGTQPTARLTAKEGNTSLILQLSSSKETRTTGEDGREGGERGGGAGGERKLLESSLNEFMASMPQLDARNKSSLALLDLLDGARMPSPTPIARAVRSGINPNRGESTPTSQSLSSHFLKDEKASQSKEVHGKGKLSNKGSSSGEDQSKEDEAREKQSTKAEVNAGLSKEDQSNGHQSHEDHSEQEQSKQDSTDVVPQGQAVPPASPDTQQNALMSILRRIRTGLAPAKTQDPRLRAKLLREQAHNTAAEIAKSTQAPSTSTAPFPSLQTSATVVTSHQETPSAADNSGHAIKVSPLASAMSMSRSSSSSRLGVGLSQTHNNGILFSNGKRPATQQRVDENQGSGQSGRAISIPLPARDSAEGENSAKKRRRTMDSERAFSDIADPHDTSINSVAAGVVPRTSLSGFGVNTPSSLPVGNTRPSPFQINRQRRKKITEADLNQLPQPRYKPNSPSVVPIPGSVREEFFDTFPGVLAYFHVCLQKWTSQSAPVHFACFHKDGKIGVKMTTHIDPTRVTSYEVEAKYATEREAKDAVVRKALHAGLFTIVRGTAPWQPAIGSDRKRDRANRSNGDSEREYASDSSENEDHYDIKPSLSQLDRHMSASAATLSSYPPNKRQRTVPAPYRQTEEEDAEVIDFTMDDGIPVSLDPVNDLEETCVDRWGPTKVPKYELSAGSNGLWGAKVHVDVSRSRIQSYWVEPMFRSRAEARIAVARIAIEEGALKEIEDEYKKLDPDSDDDSDEDDKPKKETIFKREEPQMSTTLQQISVNPVSDLEEICLERWGPNHLPEFVLKQNRMTSKFGGTLAVWVSPTKQEVFAVEDLYKDRSAAREAVASLAIDEGVLDMIEQRYNRINPNSSLGQRATQVVMPNRQAQASQGRPVYANWAKELAPSYYPSAIGIQGDTTEELRMMRDQRNFEHGSGRQSASREYGYDSPDRGGAGQHNNQGRNSSRNESGASSSDPRRESHPGMKELADYCRQEGLKEPEYVSAMQTDPKAPDFGRPIALFVLVGHLQFRLAKLQLGPDTADKIALRVLKRLKKDKEKSLLAAKQSGVRN